MMEVSNFVLGSLRVASLKQPAEITLDFVLAVVEPFAVGGEQTVRLQ
jgi:hypothetical protein